MFLADLRLNGIEACSTAAAKQLYREQTYPQRLAKNDAATMAILKWLWTTPP